MKVECDYCNKEQEVNQAEYDSIMEGSLYLCGINHCLTLRKEIHH